MSGPDNPYSAPQNPFADVSQGASPNLSSDPVDKLKIPAITLLVLAPLSIIAMGADFGMRVVTISSGNVPVIFDAPGAAQQALVGAYIGGAVDLISIVCQIAVIFGALAMLKAKSYSMALAAGVISVIPCFTACCVVGIPFGIWALVVLSDTSVKAAFRT